MRNTSILALALCMAIVFVSGCGHSTVPAGGGGGSSSGGRGDSPNYSQLDGINKAGVAKISAVGGVVYTDVTSGKRVAAAKGPFVTPVPPTTIGTNYAVRRPDGKWDFRVPDISVPSPGRKYAARLRTLKDEYGDPGYYALEITNAHGAVIKTLAKSRVQYPCFFWLDSQEIALSVRDKYQIPHLYIANLTTGKNLQLYSNPQMAEVLPVGYWAPGKQLLVEMSPVPLISRTSYETLWSVGVDGRAVKLAVLWKEPELYPKPAKMPSGPPAPPAPQAGGISK